MNLTKDYWDCLEAGEEADGWHAVALDPDSPDRLALDALHISRIWRDRQTSLKTKINLALSLNAGRPKRYENIHGLHGRNIVAFDNL